MPITMKSLNDSLQIIIANQVTKEYFDEEVHKLNSRLDAHEEHLKDLEARVKVLESLPKTIPSDIYTEIYTELREQEFRKRNIMALGIPEVNSKNRDQIFAKERNTVKKLLADLEITNKDTKVRLLRIGKKGSSDNNRPRPLRITLKNNMIQNSILTNANKLKEKRDWKGISIVPDLTKVQQKLGKSQREKLLSDAQEMNQELSDQDIDEGVEFRVVGHYGLGNLRIQKTFRRPANSEDG